MAEDDEKKAKQRSASLERSGREGLSAPRNQRRAFFAALTCRFFFGALLAVFLAADFEPLVLDILFVGLSSGRRARVTINDLWCRSGAGVRNSPRPFRNDVQCNLRSRADKRELFLRRRKLSPAAILSAVMKESCRESTILKHGTAAFSETIA